MTEISAKPWVECTMIWNEFSNAPSLIIVIQITVNSPKLLYTHPGTSQAIPSELKDLSLFWGGGKKFTTLNLTY